MKTINKIFVYFALTGISFIMAYLAIFGGCFTMLIMLNSLNLNIQIDLVSGGMVVGFVFGVIFVIFWLCGKKLFIDEI